MLASIADGGNCCKEAGSERVIHDVRHGLHALDFEEGDENVDESKFKGVCQLLNRLERNQAVRFRNLQDLIEKLALEVLSSTHSPNASVNDSTASAQAAAPTAAAEKAFVDVSKESKATLAGPSPRLSSSTPPAPSEMATCSSASPAMPQPRAIVVAATSSDASAPASPASPQSSRSRVGRFYSEPTIPSMDSRGGPIMMSKGFGRRRSTKKDEVAVKMGSKKITSFAKLRGTLAIETTPAPRPKDYEGVRQWLSALCLWFVTHRAFEVFISTVIVLNSIEVGMRVEFDIRGLDITWFHTIETVFLVIYIFELLMHFMGNGWRIITNEWILFDLVIVCAGIVVLLMEAASSDWEPSFIEHVLILRVLRILRLIRALRLIQFMKVLAKLVNGLLHSMNALLSTSFLVILFLYIFAVVGVEIMRQDEALNRLEVVQTHFPSVPIAMLTLSQFVTLDSIASIYFPIVSKQPLLGFFFFPLVFLLSIALMGLVAAFLLEAALDRAQTDKEMFRRHVRNQTKRLEPSIREAFRQIDANNNGVISREEVMAAYEFLPESLTEFLQAESLLELFEMLDEDDSGDVSEDEFVENLLATALSDVSLETMQMLKLLRIQRRRMSDIAHQLHRLTESFFPEIKQQASTARSNVQM